MISLLIYFLIGMLLFAIIHALIKTHSSWDYQEYEAFVIFAICVTAWPLELIVMVAMLGMLMSYKLAVKISDVIAGTLKRSFTKGG